MHSAVGPAAVRTGGRAVRVRGRHTRGVGLRQERADRLLGLDRRDNDDRGRLAAAGSVRGGRGAPGVPGRGGPET